MLSQLPQSQMLPPGLSALASWCSKNEQSPPAEWAGCYLPCSRQLQPDRGYVWASRLTGGVCSANAMNAPKRQGNIGLRREAHTSDQRLGGHHQFPGAVKKDMQMQPATQRWPLVRAKMLSVRPKPGPVSGHRRHESIPALSAEYRYGNRQMNPPHQSEKVVCGRRRSQLHLPTSCGQ